MDIDVAPYISPCGGGKITLKDHATINGNETTANENAILVLCYMARCLPESKDTFANAAAWHERRTNLGFGRYSRRPGDAKLIRQSHDNLTAWAWASVFLLGGYPVADILDFSKWRLYNYCLTALWDIRCQLQGSQVFPLKLAANRKPGWLTTIWFTGSCMVQDHASDGYCKSFLETDIVHAKWHLLSPLKQKLLTWGMGLMEKRREGPKRWFCEWFHEDESHPVRLSFLDR